MPDEAFSRFCVCHFGAHKWPKKVAHQTNQDMWLRNYIVFMSKPNFLGDCVFRTQNKDASFFDWHELILILDLCIKMAKNIHDCPLFYRFKKFSEKWIGL